MAAIAKASEPRATSITAAADPNPLRRHPDDGVDEFEILFIDRICIWHERGEKTGQYDGIDHSLYESEAPS